MPLWKLLCNRLQTYAVIFMIWYKNYTAYIYDIIWINVTFIIRLTVIIFFYKALYQVSGTTSIDGYTMEELIRSLIFVQAVVLSKPRISDEIWLDIKSGKIGVFLLNPISYIWFKFFEHMPRFFYNLCITMVIGLLMWFLFIWSIHTSVPWILGGTVLLLWWMMISFFGYMMVWLFWFYTEDTDPYRLLYSKLDLVFGWNILPVVFMPMIMQTIAFAMPFVYSGYTAGLLFVRFDMQRFWQYLWMQCLRIIILISICTLIYTHGKKKVTINGW